jgi:hypothetical protein
MEMEIDELATRIPRRLTDERRHDRVQSVDTSPTFRMTGLMRRAQSHA